MRCFCVLYVAACTTLCKLLAKAISLDVWWRCVSRANTAWKAITADSCSTRALRTRPVDLFHIDRSDVAGKRSRAGPAGSLKPAGRRGLTAENLHSPPGVLALTCQCPCTRSGWIRHSPGAKLQLQHDRHSTYLKRSALDSIYFLCLVGRRRRLPRGAIRTACGNARPQVGSQLRTAPWRGRAESGSPFRGVIVIECRVALE